MLPPPDLGAVCNGPDPYEPNDSQAQAKMIPLDTNGQARIGAGVDKNSPDYYTFTTTKGDPIDVVGPYQSTAGFVRRDWAAAHREQLAAYIAAYIEGLRWATDPANRTEAIALLAERIQISSRVAESCYDRVTHPESGFARDAKVDSRGMDCVVKLRNEFSPKAGGAMRSTAHYVDETYYNTALATLTNATVG